MDYGGAMAQAMSIAGGWLIAGFIACVPVFLVIRWWTDGSISAGESMTLLGLIAFIILLMIGPTPGPMKVLLFWVLVASAIGMPLLFQLLNKRTADAYEEQKEALFRSAIEKNPQNVAAYIELARSLYPRGQRTEAVSVMEHAIQLSPKTTLEEQYILERWRQEMLNLPNPIVICRWCREDTPSDRPSCVHCGKPLSGVQEVRDAMLEDLPNSLRMLAMLLAGFIGLSFLFSLLTPLAANLLMIIAVAGGMVWFWKRL